jgi:hypothetical protein
MLLARRKKGIFFRKMSVLDRAFHVPTVNSNQSDENEKTHLADPSCCFLVAHSFHHRGRFGLCADDAVANYRTDRGASARSVRTVAIEL